jgi:hypothetical protein
MRKAIFLLSASITLFLFSCQKELALDLPGANTTGGTGSVNNKLVGSWKFIQLHANTFASNEGTVAGLTQRTETTSDYTSINNTGTIVFTAQAMTNTNVGYAFDSWAFNKVFENGVLTDTFTVPLQGTIPPATASANYTSITADSIVVQAGGQGVTPVGFKLKFSNDTLFMTQYVHETSVQNVQGVNYNTVRRAVAVTTLKKQ